MPSKIRRRSGNAVVAYCNLIGWRPTSLYLVGVGLNHEEVDVCNESWPLLYVYGWEPNIRTYRTIKDKFRGMLYPMAVGENSGVGHLKYPKNGKDGGTLLGRDRYDCEDEVKVVTLDSMDLARLDGKGLLWLDCEGSELAAIYGGEKFISKNVQVINVEMTSKPYGSDWPCPRVVNGALYNLGFRQAWIHTIRTHVGQFDCIYVREDLYNPDLVCCF